MDATAVGEAETQRRSYPQSFGQFETGGYEVIRRFDLPGHAERVASEAVALLTAPECPEATTDLILESSQLALQIHESVGHAIELDRILGWEAAFAGTSFLELPRLGSLDLRLAADEHHRRRHPPRGARHLRLRRRGHPRPAGRHRQGGPVGRRALRARLGRRGRPAPRRHGAGRRLQPAADGADDQRRPACPGSRRSTRSSPPPTTASSWPPTGRGPSTTSGSTSSSAARSPGRSATGSLGRMLKNPTYTGITPQFWATMDMLAGGAGVDPLGRPQLRQGPADADGPHRPPRRARPASGASAWG